MSAATTSMTRRDPAIENAARVAVVAALSATSMLFASLASAYLVRRSFADWRPSTAVWPIVLLAFALAASGALEAAIRGEGRRRRLALMTLALASGLYLLGAVSVIASTANGAEGLGSPFHAFVALLLGVHVVHAIAGGLFASWVLRREAAFSENARLLARLVTHFLTALLFAIVFLLFGLQ